MEDDEFTGEWAEEDREETDRQQRLAEAIRTGDLRTIRELVWAGALLDTIAYSATEEAAHHRQWAMLPELVALGAMLTPARFADYLFSTQATPAGVHAIMAMGVRPLWGFGGDFTPRNPIMAALLAEGFRFPAQDPDKLFNAAVMRPPYPGLVRQLLTHFEYDFQFLSRWALRLSRAASTWKQFAVLGELAQAGIPLDLDQFRTQPEAMWLLRRLGHASEFHRLLTGILAPVASPDLVRYLLRAV